MLKSFKTRTALLAAVCAVGLAGGVAIAQTIAVPTVTSMGITDIMQVVKGGVPSAQSTYTTLFDLASDRPLRRPGAAGGRRPLRHQSSATR